MALPVSLDHCVIKVTNWERSNAFYRDVMGATLVERPAGWAYRFGDCQLNVHGLCFEWKGPIADAMAHLERRGVAIERGPMERFGVRDNGTSIYFRDPDGSLMEFISYAD